MYSFTGSIVSSSGGLLLSQSNVPGSTGSTRTNLPPCTCMPTRHVLPDLAADVDLRDHAAGVEVVEVADRGEEVGAGDRVRVVAVGLDRVVDRPGEDLARDPRLLAEAVGLLVVLEEGVELGVVALVLEREDVQPHVLALGRAVRPR